MLKNSYKRQVMQLYQNNYQLDAEKIVENCYAERNDDAIKRLCNRGFKKWFQPSLFAALGLE